MAHAMVHPMGYLTGQMPPWCAPWVSIFLQYSTVLGVLCVPRSISAIMCLTVDGTPNRLPHGASQQLQVSRCVSRHAP